MRAFVTAGESHGKGLVAVILGLPAGLALGAESIQRDLARRQVGYGRGGRMAIERDEAEILSGVRHGRTLGSPVALWIRNRDWANWEEVMATEAEAGPSGIAKDGKGRNESREVLIPRPGHADLAGALKYGHSDMRNVLERASARETAARVAVGAVARKFLGELGVEVFGFVTEIGKVTASLDGMSTREKSRRAEASDLRCPDRSREKRMKQAIDDGRRRGDTLGGVFEIVARGVPVGLGSYAHWDERLDGRLAGAIMSIPAVKGVEIGAGFEAARNPGSEVQDEIFFRRGAGARTRLGGGFYRKTNRAGGLEGGVTNGEEVVVRAAMKPISTLLSPLKSVHRTTGRASKASVERSDVCAVPAASIVGEAVVAIEIAKACREKFGGDSMEEVLRNLGGYLEQIQTG